MPTEQRVRVLGLGLDARFRSMLDVFFIRSCDGHYQLAADAADVVVVDMDAVGARDAYAEHRQSNTALPSILFSLNEEQYKTRGNTVLLRKPFTVRQLQSAFEIVSLRYINVRRDKKIRPRPVPEDSLNLSEQPVRSNEITEAEQTPAPVVRTSRAAFSLSRHDEYVKLNSLLPGMASDRTQQEQFYEPDLYLQNELKLACKQAREAGKNALVKLGGGSITLDPQQGLAQMGMGKFQLREVSSFPLNHRSFKISLVPENEARVARNGAPTVLRLSELIWQVALYAAQGRVPQGAELDAPVQLRYWPNLTRLMLTSGAVRISAAWVSQAKSIRQLVDQLGLPERDVASFYSAACALDLFYSDDAIKVVEHAAKPDSRKVSVLERILRRLRS
jgi:hypothetical protein